jgi:DNA-binding transcriptional LysR family regulator
MQLRQFEYFVAVAEERHFGRAAERLRVAQPGISHQIKSFERSLGTELFIRGRTGVQLTEAGTALLDHARLVLELVDRSLEIPRLATAGKQGLIKVGTDALNVHPEADRVLAGFRERLPLVELRLHPGFGPAQIEAVRRRALDAAFVIGPLEEPDGLRYLALGSLEVRVVLPTQHRLAALDRIPRAELLKERYIAMPRTVDPALADLERRAVLGRTKHLDQMEVADATLETRLRAVAAGEGFTVTIRPEDSDLPLPGVAYRRIAGRTPSVGYGLAFVDAAASAFVTALIEIAEDIAGARSSTGSEDDTTSHGRRGTGQRKEDVS